ncbi:hypothetical protein ALP66_200085 [Pseudomonas amygdali pv. photiniae]|uniref:Conjugal transfer protein n=1 Tax=Pseudomonas amygdali pv. photiniae TaxID=251724 RepID=A0A0P9URM7_PSEA0|nr:hypothetical protein ALO53_200025 [Pseudomonas amygdali pv. photiniae]RMS49393.1 hypothetical protein ALP66_200085 [Pseudomonas amygdali pv. photiniae]
MDKYTKQDLDSKISVKLTLRDLISLSWGHESVSFVLGTLYGRQTSSFRLRNAEFIGVI